MRTYSVDYSKDRPDSRVLMNRGFWVHDVPRLIAWCRLFGHKPVVDGTQGIGTTKPSRWVACDRCGIRTDPQGMLDPDQWNIGQAYTGPFNPTQPLSPRVRKQLIARGHDAGIRLPGGWPKELTTTVGGQLVIGRSQTIGADFKVGNCGSEQVLAAHIGLGPIGALYLHTEDHGKWLQRRLNPTGYESREIGFSIHRGRLSWKLWSPRNEHKASDPWWMRGSFSIDPRHYLLGKVTSHKVSSTEKVPATVRMPEGDTYDVTVRMEQWSIGRKRGRRRDHWTIEWDYKPGIPYRAGDSYFSGNHPIQNVTADTPDWPALVAASVADFITRDRARHDYCASKTA